MYKSCGSLWEIANEEDKESLSSSFWTDQESEEEQRECFVKNGSSGKRNEREPGINTQENKQETDWCVKVDSMDDGTTKGKLEELEHCIREDEQYNAEEHSRDEGTEKEDEQESEEECCTQDSENVNTGINSEEESEEDKEEKDSTDKSSTPETGSADSRSEEEESEDNVKEDSKSSEDKEKYYVEEHSKDEGTEKEVEQESKEECCTQDSEHDNIGINSEEESEEDGEESDSTDKSSTPETGSADSRSEEEESEDYVKKDSESSEDEEQNSVEEEEDTCLSKVEGKESKHETYSVENEVVDMQKLINEKQNKKSCSENEETGGEDLSSAESKEEEENAINENDKYEGTEGEQSMCAVIKDSTGEESESEVLESEEEVERFIGDDQNEVTTCERLRKKVVSEEETSHGIETLKVLKEGSIGEGVERKPESQIMHFDEEDGEDEGHLLNRYCTRSSNIEEKWLEEQSFEEYSKKEQVQNNSTCVMDEQHVNSNIQNDKWVHGDDTVVAELANQLCTNKGETHKACSEQKWGNSINHLENEQEKEEDLYGEKEGFEDYPGSISSPTVSILTSGYGTYRPDSPKDDLDGMDFRDDCTLTGLEEDVDCSDVVHCEDDYTQSVYQPSIVLEQQITSLSLRGSQHSPLNHCEASKSPAFHPSVGDGLDITAEKRLGSSDVHEENEALYFAAKSAALLLSEDLRKSDHNVAYGSDEWNSNTKYDDYHHPFNLKLSKNVTIVEHVKEHGRPRQEKRKTNKSKSQFLKYEPYSDLEERLDQLRVSASHKRCEPNSESEETDSYSDRHSSATEELPSAFQAYVKGMARSHSESDLRPRPKSFIRPVMDHPHTRNLKKTDPVAKYFQYKQSWEMFKPPGEKSRKELHWAIREQLMYQPPPPKPQRTYVPNTYVVPTEKKRSALRWEIRHDLANGIIPTKITYP